LLLGLIYFVLMLIFHLGFCSPIKLEPVVRRKVAVVLWGRVRSLEAHVKSLLKFVVNNYDADVIIATNDEGGELKTKLRGWFSERLKAAMLVDQPKLHMLQVLAGDCGIPDCEFFKKLEGTQFSLTSATCIMQIFYQQQAYNALALHEVARGEKYEWVISSRPDFEFLTFPPPLGMLNNTLAWSQDGESWGGVHDRMTIYPRNIAAAGLQRWNFIFSGQIKRLLEKAKWKNCETYFYHTVKGSGFDFGRFRAVGFVRCLPDIERECSGEVQCFRKESPTKRCAPGKNFKYEIEYGLAKRFAQELQTVQFKWSDRFIMHGKKCKLQGPNDRPRRDWGLSCFKNVRP
jgi:hypothetical protein